MQTKLSLITKKAREDKRCKFNNLIHLVNEANLRFCFGRLKKKESVGIDEVSLREYGRGLQENVQKLVKRMKTMSYKPQAVKRVCIPKGGGEKRPLGILTVEDKLVQAAFTRILEAIYEVDFKDVSYGFRKRKSCHQALAKVDRVIREKPVNYVIDADIKGFFDNVDHQWMRRCLEERIADRKFIRYIMRMLRSGVREGGQHTHTEKGIPQGGVVSPILANIYLHYVLDLWMVKQIKSRSKGYVEMVRYCDDFVIFVQYKQEAEQILSLLGSRLSKFGLELSEEKTCITRFGRSAHKSYRQNGDKPGVFNFLGFTHFCSTNRNGKFKVGRKIERKRYARGIKKISRFLKLQRSFLPLPEIWKTVSLFLRGYYRYYGVSGLSRQLRKFHRRVEQILRKWLNRRSQKRNLSWGKFLRYLERYPLPKPRIYHDLYAMSF